MSNIVDIKAFAKAKQEQQEREEVNLFDIILQKFEDERQAVSEIALTMTHEICTTLIDLGINVEENPDCIRDILTIAESVKALIYRARGEEYIFQDVSNAVVNLGDDNAEEILQDFLYGID